MGDRDYMKSSSEDDKRVEAYEKGAREREYGDLASPRMRRIRKAVFWVVGILVLLWLVSWLVG